jgi:hypothetical protein
MKALRKALVGEGRCFAPFAWEALPALVNVTVGTGWWTDPVLCRRLLLDLLGATDAQAAVVDILHPSEWKSLEQSPGLEELSDDGLGDPTVAAAITKLGNLAAMMPVDLIAALPVLGDDASDLSDDILCDVARGAMATGIGAILVAGVDTAGPLVKRLARLADNFDLPVIALGKGDEVRETTGNGQVSLSGAASVGVVLTPGDIGRDWTLAQLREFGARP